MREMAEDIAVVQPCHGDLGNNHFKERREGSENAELFRVETKASCCREVAALHDTGWNKDFRMLLVNNLDAGRTLQVT